MSKINAKGQYTRHPGITVVAAVREQDEELWTAVRDCLRKSSASPYFAFTPVSSYHMTVFNLYTEHGVGKSKWKPFVDQNLGYFEALSKALSSEEEINFRLTNVKVANGGTIKLIVEPSSEQMRAYMRTAKKFGVEDGVPAFHITLGHCYKLMTAEIEAIVKAQLKTELTEIFKRYSDSLRVSPPRLCSFEDMTKFKPWDGKVNPFRQESVGFAQAFFSSIAKAASPPAETQSLKTEELASTPNL